MTHSLCKRTTRWMTRWVSLHERPESLSSKCRTYVLAWLFIMSRDATTWERMIMSCHTIQSWEARDASCRILSDVVRAVPARPRPTLPMSLYECPTSWAHPRLHTQHLPRHRHRSATTNRTSLPPHRSTHTVPAPMYSGNLNETAVAPKTSIEPNRNKGRIPHRLRRLRLGRRGPQSS